ncbi:MAG: hypothetical protein KKC03_03295 [Bacteroidetes bacterium]|nr:hypothetical protein [Bacteroidota bacterium]
MVKILAFNNLNDSSAQILKSVYKDCNKYKNRHTAFLSTRLKLDEFLVITEQQEAQLVYDFTEKTEKGGHLNASISILLNSLLFLDLPDKSLYRADDGVIDIAHLRKMIIPLKYRHKVKDIYIDNFYQVTCNLMGRNLVWEPKNTTDIKVWKDRQMEYKMALLFYMSRKFDLNFYIGMEQTSLEQKPRHIKGLTFGNTFDMVDEIDYR